MSITYTLNNNSNIAYYLAGTVFPSGELNPCLTSSLDINVTTAKINARLNNSDDILELLFAADALKRAYGPIDIKLMIYKLPYAQQDRVCNPGESLTLAVIGDIINSIGASEVIVFDTHSSVSDAIIKNIKVISQYDIFYKLYSDWSNKVLVAPDAGSQKKVFSFAKRVGAAAVICCDKLRDLETGKIIRSVLNGSASEVVGKELVILDDICLKGGTFLSIAGMLMLHKPKSIDLVVTHGVFNDNALNDLKPVFNNIYTTNSYNKDLQSEDNLTIINY